MLSIPIANPLNVNASVTMMAVQFANRLLQALSAVEIKLN